MAHDKLLNSLTAAAAFVLVLAIWTAVVVLWSARRRRQSKKIHRRIGLIQDPRPPARRLWHEGQEAVTVVPGMAASRFAGAGSRKSATTPAGRRLPRRCWAGWPGRACCRRCAVLALAHHVLLAIGGPAVVLSIFWMYIKHCMSKQQILFDQQFLDALDLAARSLRAGHPLLGARSA